MSTIAITFETQPLDFGTAIRGQIDIRFDYGGGGTPILTERLSTSGYTSGYFQEIPWGVGSDDTQARTFSSAFQRDYKDVGGPKNLSVAVVGNVATITAKVGTFSNFTYTGNVIIVNSVIDNSVQIDPLVFGVTNTLVGNCLNIDYAFTNTGGTGPYQLYEDSSLLIGGWDGSSSTFTIKRGNPRTFKVIDSVGTESTTTRIIPRKIVPGEFKISTIQYEFSSDLLVVSLTTVAGTTPLEYSLDAQGAVTGGAYQSSNAFPGVLPGTYELFIKDVYGCEINKTVIVSELQDSSQIASQSYFEVMDANSIIYSECTDFDKDTKKNFHNTTSRSELSDINYGVVQVLDPSDYLGTQFKSSYPFHSITFHDDDGSKTDIFPWRIQENLGSKEKVDCKLFPYDGKTGVYFDGGNSYDPDTTTVNGASEHLLFTPEWALVGQLVSIDGIGSFTIGSTGYDDILGRGFFVIDTVTATSLDGIVQVKYNKQPYNLFEFYFGLLLDTKGRIVIEKGQDFDNIVGNKWVSEYLYCRNDEVDDLLIESSDPKNKGNMVYQSGITFKKRRWGKFRPTFDGESSTFPGDSREYGLTQTTYLNYKLELEGLSAKEVYQLTIVSGLDGFMVNNMPLVRKAYPEIEALGESNMYTLKCEFGYSGNGLANIGDENVLSVSSGQISGGSTGKVSYNGDIRIEINGLFLMVNGDYVALP